MLSVQTSRYCPGTTKAQKWFTTIPIRPVIQAMYGSHDIADSMHYLERKLMVNVEHATLNRVVCWIYTMTWPLDRHCLMLGMRVISKKVTLHCSSRLTVHYYVLTGPLKLGFLSGSFTISLQTCNIRKCS